MTDQPPPSDLGPPDWCFELRVDHVPDAVGRIAFDTASGAMVVLRSELSRLKGLVAHVEHCLRAAVAAGIPVESLANELALRPDHLQAVIDGSQPLIPDLS